MPEALLRGTRKKLKKRAGPMQTPDPEREKHGWQKQKLQGDNAKRDSNEMYIYQMSPSEVPLVPRSCLRRCRKVSGG